MNVKKAVITAAGRDQRALPLQTLIDRDGEEKSVLSILVEQALVAKVESICVVTWPGDEARYAQALGRRVGRVRFVAQPQPLGYGHAISCAGEFVGDDPFLHLVGDHLYVAGGEKTCAQRVIELAELEDCAVSSVQPTRESQLHLYGTVAGRRVAGRAGVYRIDAVAEKPTPTEAEQTLTVSGLRAGHYLCFFGQHVLTPALMEILCAPSPEGPVTLSAALTQLARREEYLALEDEGRRYNIGVPYGLMTAQLALALSGRDRGETLARLAELLADREMSAMAAGLHS